MCPHHPNICSEVRKNENEPKDIEKTTNIDSNMITAIRESNTPLHKNEDSTTINTTFNEETNNVASVSKNSSKSADNAYYANNANVCEKKQ